MPFTCIKCGQKVPVKTLSGEIRTKCPLCGTALENVPSTPLPSAIDVPALLKPAPEPVPPNDRKAADHSVGSTIVDPVAFEKQLARWGAVGGAVLFFGLAIGWAILGRGTAAEKAASLEWPTTQCTIKSCELQEVRRKPRRLPYEIVSYTVDVTYTYVVDGETYEGDRLVLSDNSWDQGPAQSRRSKYQVGSIHQVYYDPNDPERSVLEPGDTRDARTNVGTLLGVVLPLGLAVVAGMLVVLFFVISRQVGTPGWAHHR